MFNIGCHLSVSKGLFRMGKDALSIGANTFQCFLRNPRGGAAKKLDLADGLALKQLMDENGFAPIVVHAPYTLNACAKVGQASPVTTMSGDNLCISKR